MHSIEVLESRIAPAVIVAANGRSATYVDVDGDHVTISVSIGTLTAADFTTAPEGKGDQLELIDLSGGGFDNANLTVTVKREPGGDGLANIGYINSTGHDLGAVVVPGDLGRITAGDPTTAATGFALKSLTVNSMGSLGTDTQAAGGTLDSTMTGAIGSITVKHDLDNEAIGARGPSLGDRAPGKIGSVVIGGSIIGGPATSSGSVSATAGIGSVKIGHDVEGGTAMSTGFIFAESAGIHSVTIGGSIIGGAGDSAGFLGSNGPIASLTIGGSVIGGSGESSGELFNVGSIGTIKIGHDLDGGSGTQSGEITANSIASLAIGGSLAGGSAADAGSVEVGGGIGALTIGHNLLGGSIGGTASTLDSSGAIIATNGRIASVTIGGSIISGIDTSTGGSLTNNATIRAGQDIGALTVKGSILGNNTADGASLVIISAVGQATPKGTVDSAIGKISVGERVEDAQILAGYNVSLTATNADAQIGAVTVGENLVASSIVAGAVAGPDGIFGTADDTKPSVPGVTDSPTIFSRIASITIAGQVFGTPASVSSTDGYGFVAEGFGSVKIGGTTISLATLGDHEPLAIGETTDFNLEEIA